MRLLDHDEPIDPEIAASLDAIDAVLAGEPVDARYADLAEIALLLSSERPEIPTALAQSMDQRVARRFPPAPAKVNRRRRWPSAGFWEATGALTAAVAVLAAIVVVASGGHGASSASTSSAAVSAASAAASRPPAHTQSTPAPSRSAASGAAKSQPALVPPAGQSSSQSGSPPLQPPTSGRKVVQGAQLSLAAPPNRIDDVAQQVYDVIGGLNGIVENSTVTQTGGPDGYAEFQLSVPNASLGQAMSRLSSLNYAVVVSRTDQSQDITDAYGAAQRRLADARALRTSLLQQLAGATTTEQVDSLKAQIHDAEASISSDEATLARMDQQVNFSQLSLEITARSTPAPVSHGGGGFGIGRAAHDAGRVLTVAAGVALIALAALTPIALVVALGWWIGSAVKRRRREQALDAA
ncbi:MAG: DUF4349 domain-containing protein [Solirubrobacterales bacterium]|nr:DUF4349 domain-containing protein [Solirubrobacterales bacterium]